MTLVFASDNNGCLLLGIALYSLLKHAKQSTYYKIYILSDSIDAENRAGIESLKKEFSFELHFVSIDGVLKKHIKKSYDAWPDSMFSRMFTASLLPEKESKVLYCDIDVLFCDDVTDIMEIDMGEHILGAVYQIQHAGNEEWKRKLGIPQEYSYFNSGILLMNLDLIRKEGIENKLLEYLDKHKEDLDYPDQDVLNGVLFNRTKKLHPKWNWYDSHSRKFLTKKASHQDWWGNFPDVRYALEASVSPRIIHFVGRPKPIVWNYLYSGDLYRKLWLDSPWKHVPLQGRNSFKIRIKKRLYRLADALTRRKIRKLLGGK